jgi:hypothetical protein
MLQRVGPKPLIELENLKAEADWIEAGRQIFLGADHIHQRTYDPRFIALAKDKKALDELNFWIKSRGADPPRANLGIPAMRCCNGEPFKLQAK